jgi:hypothetical protein
MWDFMGATIGGMGIAGGKSQPVEVEPQTWRQVFDSEWE